MHLAAVSRIRKTLMTFHARLDTGIGRLKKAIGKPVAKVLSCVNRIRKPLYRFIVWLMTSTILMFSVVFGIIFAGWMLALVAALKLGLYKQLDIAPVLLFSLLFALLAAAIRASLVKRYAKISM